MSNKRIASAFRFTEQDLKANHNGLLSQAQRATLRVRRASALMALGAALIPIPVFMILGQGSPATVCLTAFMLMAAVLGLWRSVRIQRDLRAGRIMAHFGRIHLRVQNRRGSELFIETERGLHRFRIGTAQMLALRDGDYYTIYAAPRSDTLLSIEPVDMTRLDEGAVDDAVDLSALADDVEVEKPKRDMYVLGDDGELEMRRER